MRLDSLLQDAEFWRARAELTRSLVQAIDDQDAQAILLEVAAGYDRLAKHAGNLVRTSGRAGDAPAATRIVEA
jgi:hypothetical protein